MICTSSALFSWSVYRFFNMTWIKSNIGIVLFYGAAFFFCAFYGLVFVLKWKAAFALLFFIVFLLLNLYSMEAGLLLVFFTIPFDRLGKIGPESSITFAKIFIGLLIIAWVTNTLLSKDPKPLMRLKDSPLFILGLLFLFFSFFSVINAHNTDIFVKQLVRRLSNVTLFFLIINVITRKELLYKALAVLIFSYVLVGLTGLYELSSGESILKAVWGDDDTALEYTLESDTFRVSGPGGDPDFHAVSVIFPTLIAGTFLFMTASRFRRSLIVLFIILMLVNILGTGSRGGLLSLLIGGGLMWFFTEMRWKYTTAVIAAVVLALFILGFAVLNPNVPTERYIGQSGGKSLLYRIGFTKMAFSMIKDHPIAGIGTGNFPSEYNRYMNGNPIVPRDHPYWTHNSFLQAWAENGIFGFIVYVMLYLFSAKLMFDVIMSTKDHFTRSLAVLLLSVVASYFFFAGTSNVLENENYWLVFALVTVVNLIHKKEHQYNLQ